VRCFRLRRRPTLNRDQSKALSFSGPDPRFYTSLGPRRLGDLAALAGAQAPTGAPEDLIVCAATLSRANPAAISFVADRKYASAAAETGARACFVSAATAGLLPSGCVPLVSTAPYGAWALVAGHLHHVRRLDPTAPAVHPSAQFEGKVAIGHGAVIGEDVLVGEGASIGPGAVIGPGVAIGRGCEIGARVVINCALVGDNVRILAGAVIGESGFGVTAGAAGLIEIPQLGRVIIQDGVSIGANTCVDRGAYEDTVIGENSKIDNLVQIAHNVVIGRNCVLAAHTGLSGSVKIGDGAQLGGRVGLADHVTVGAGARIAAAAGVMRDVPAGESWVGAPARPMRQFFRETAWLTRAASRKQGDGRHEDGGG